MDAPSDSSVSTPGQAALLAVQQSVRLMVGWLIGFLAFTEAERLKAGIYLGGKHRDR